MYICSHVCFESRPTLLEPSRLFIESYLLYVELAAPCKLPYHIDKCDIPTLYQLSSIGPSLNCARDTEHVDRIGT